MEASGPREREGVRIQSDLNLYAVQAKAGLC